MTEAELDKLQLDGANARAFGRSSSDNPFYRRESMPICTGEDIPAWAIKEAAWRTGWTIEDAIRRPQEENAILDAYIAQARP